MRNFYWILFFFLFKFSVFSQIIDPYKFIATLKFDDKYWDYLSLKQEQMFPIAFSFITTQKANGGSFDAENACENIVKYAIGDSIYGTGRTNLPNRGPNDQRPVLYFHFTRCTGFDVYEYWLYYADNDYLNNHEHDWEKYFVYVKESIPMYVYISNHNNFNLFSWGEITKDNDHIIIGVDGGSHAMGINYQRGVEIRYNGDVLKNAGRLNFGDGGNFPWRIYSNDINLSKAINYIQKPDCFFHGDPVYWNIPMLSKSKDYGKCSNAPWIRKEWDNPPCPISESK